MLNFFSVGFEPLILLLGLAITNAVKRSFGGRLVRRENWSELLGDQQQEDLEEIDRKVKQGNIDKKRSVTVYFFRNQEI